MFENNMTANLELIAIQGEHTTEWSNPWRKLVSKEFTSFLDSIASKDATKQETTEDNCDE